MSIRYQLLFPAGKAALGACLIRWEHQDGRHPKATILKEYKGTLDPRSQAVITDRFEAGQPIPGARLDLSVETFDTDFAKIDQYLGGLL